MANDTTDDEKRLIGHVMRRWAAMDTHRGRYDAKWQYEPIIEALIKQGKIKGHNTGEGGIGAAPEDNGGVAI